jgi:hypothetical protein
MYDSYVSVRDTLRAVTGKSAILQRDLRTASDAVLLSRARSLDAACSASLRHLDRSQSNTTDNERGRRAPAPRRATLDRSFIELRAALSTCAAEYRGMSQADRPGQQMRERGVGIAIKTQLAIRNFEQAAESYLLSVGIRVRPYGSGNNPYAGSSRRNPS